MGKDLNRQESTVSQLLVSESATEKIREQVQDLFQRAATVASDEDAAEAERQLAVQLLAFADLKTAIECLGELLTPQTSQSLQRSAVNALGAQSSDEVTTALLDGWTTFGPQIRRDVVDTVMSRPARIVKLLDAVEAEEVKSSDIERDKKQLLLNHPNKSIQSRSQELLGNDLNETPCQGSRKLPRSP